MKPEHIGVFVILAKKNCLLLGKRKNSYKSGSYGFPGGRLELTESLLDCAKRELLEETGVNAINLKHLGVVRELQDGYNFIHFGFVCTEWTGEVRIAEPNKCAGWSFYTKNQLPDNILPAHLAGITLLDNPLPTYIDILKK